jgi:hypothetical protein
VKLDHGKKTPLISVKKVNESGTKSGHAPIAPNIIEQKRKKNGFQLLSQSRCNQLKKPTDVAPTQVPLSNNVAHECIETNASILSKTDKGSKIMQENES